MGSDQPDPFKFVDNVESVHSLHVGAGHKRARPASGSVQQGPLEQWGSGEQSERHSLRQRGSSIKGRDRGTRSGSDELCVQPRSRGRSNKRSNRTPLGSGDEAQASEHQRPG